MKTCRACGKELARNARFCPECGYRFTHPFVKFVAWCFGIVLAAGMLGSILDKGAKPSNEKPPTPAEERAKSEADARVQAGYLGAVTLKGAMRNPESFKLYSALLMTNGAVCYDYRAQNGFGGMNRERAVLTTAGALKLNDSGLWNKQCAHKEGKDLAPLINVQLNGLSALF